MADQDTDSQSISPSSDVVPLQDDSLQGSELSDKKLVPFPQQNNLDLELKEIEIERKRLELDKERFLFEQEKAKAEIELKSVRDEVELEAKKLLIQLENLQNNQEVALKNELDHQRSQRQRSNHSHWFKMGVSTVLIGAGIWLIAKGDSLGPYLLGTGAGGAGIQSASELMQKKREDLESLTSADSMKNQEKS